MLDPVFEFWFGLAQSIGAIATAIALFLVKQKSYRRNQSRSMQHEITIRLRHWIYRMPDKDYAFEIEEDRVTMYFNNTGQVAAHRINFYHVFKSDEPDKTISKKDMEDNLAKEKPIIR
jgi:hypothetical protein